MSVKFIIVIDTKYNILFTIVIVKGKLKGEITIIESINQLINQSINRSIN